MVACFHHIQRTTIQKSISPMSNSLMINSSLMSTNSNSPPSLLDAKLIDVQVLVIDVGASNPRSKDFVVEGSRFVLLFEASIFMVQV